jgi:hypothetical protein
MKAATAALMLAGEAADGRGVVARQRLVDALEHGMPVDQQIEDDDRRDQQQRDEVDQRQPAAPHRAMMAAAVAVQFCDCSASALSSAVWNEGKVGPSQSRPQRSMKALNRSVSAGSAVTSWRTCSTRIGTSKTSAKRQQHGGDADDQDRRPGPFMP